MKSNKLCALIGLLGSTVANALGGWDTALQTLVIFMAIDYLSGLAVAGIFKKSKKSKNGALESKASWKGLCRKGMELFLVLIAYRLDLLFGINFVRYSVIIGFCANEFISIVENAGLMGIKLPSAVTNAVELLKDKAEEEHNERN